MFNFQKVLCILVQIAWIIAMYSSGNGLGVLGMPECVGLGDAGCAGATTAGACGLCVAGSYQTGSGSSQRGPAEECALQVGA
jgi:hypothetical protein